MSGDPTGVKVTGVTHAVIQSSRILTVLEKQGRHRMARYRKKEQYFSKAILQPFFLDYVRV